jgi:hypothetical protein
MESRRASRSRVVRPFLEWAAPPEPARYEVLRTERELTGDESCSLVERTAAGLSDNFLAKGPLPSRVASRNPSGITMAISPLFYDSGILKSWLQSRGNRGSVYLRRRGSHQIEG